MPFKLLLLCCLTFKFIECSKEPETLTSSPVIKVEKQVEKEQNTCDLVPQKFGLKTKVLPHEYWQYHQFPTVEFANGTEIPSNDITHAQDNVCTFAYIKKKQSGESELVLNIFAVGKCCIWNLDTPVNSLSVFGERLLLTSGRSYDINLCLDMFSRHSLETLPESFLHKDDYIVSGKLVSETMGFLLTSMGLLVKPTFTRGSSAWELEALKNCTKFSSGGDVLVLVISQPRGLVILKNQDMEPFFAIDYEPLVKFVEKAKINVASQKFILFYDESKAMLLNTNTGDVTDIPVGAEMMRFEDPWILALNGTTFTKYDIKGNALQRYTFEGAVRVVPDNRWDTFALHYSHIMKYGAQIQYVSRRVDQEINATSRALGPILPTVLLELVKSYLPGFLPEIPRITTSVFATLAYVRTRQESDLSTWKPRTSATDGAYKIYVEGNQILAVGGRIKAPKRINTVENHETLDFGLQTRNCCVHKASR